jgi:carotenoid cleavage dioxygenase-like enzyme
MAALTNNLFWGQGETEHRLDVIEGHWPTDMAGSVFVVGPDKREPGGHWFDAPGLLCRIRVCPGPDGRIEVSHRLIDTPIDRLRRRFPWLFRKVAFLELSPFGMSNLANTNVEPIGDRLFIGYDAGRPIEVDPETMRFCTPVGANDEWFQASPGVYEPGISVAAHPGADHEAGQLFFVNYSPLPFCDDVFVARWGLDGPVERWRIAGMSGFDSIHDVKVTRDHIVFSDLPFVVEPETFRGLPQPRANGDTTTLRIVARHDLETTPIGGTVTCREVVIPIPTGHLSVDFEEIDGRIRVFLEHAPLQDLMITLDRHTTGHFTGELMDPNHAGMVALAVQPGYVGRYEIDTATGAVVTSEVAWDERFWGAVLATRDTSSARARARQGQLWYSAIGYDPALVPERWWELYGEAGLHGVVDPSELPTELVPAALARIDRDSMKVVEVVSFDSGTFPHPPTFVPREGATDPDDGYVVTIVHRDGPKEVWVFDAQHLERGPLARASAGDFNPPLLLHSCWMPPRRGPRPSDYRIGWRRDVRGAVAAIPGHLRQFARVGKAVAAAAKADRPSTR